MRADRIILRDFRNVAACEVSFTDGINALIGANAQGKTNLLEAVYYAAVGSSFRGQKSRELLRHGTKEGLISLDFTGGERRQNITVRLFGDRARAVEKNGVRAARMSELMGAFRAVLFCPEHLALVKAGPAERRQFLDVAISALSPVYLAGLQRYAQILKQRNALLRTAADDPAAWRETGEVWSRQLAAEGARIARERQRYVKKAAGHLARVFAEMTGEAELPDLIYRGPAKDVGHDYEDVAATEAYLVGALTENTAREIAAGATLFGTHRDDLEILLNGFEARLYTSQGQQRSIALALKFAEGEIAREDCGEYPVFLFDDVLSELDAARRTYLLHKIEGKQVIITACEPIAAPAARVITVQDGKYFSCDVDDK